ncbi:MAG: tRNA-(ms[2]io[6]A)-hydroxylase [Sphingobacteriales bacterium]|jgi:tRNA-(ms[2]io[6]A)-hydroxylase
MEQKGVMLGLKLPTDPRWVNIVEKNIEEILTDHAYCEQKAASNAISMLVKYSEFPDVVTEMTKIAIEEMEHFGMVHEMILKRNLTLGRERKDEYVNDLLKFVQKGGGNRTRLLVDRLLFSALVEARSCERFRLLSEEIDDPELREFYRELMISEATHYTTFLGFAKKYGKDMDVDQRWQDFLQYEAEVIQKYGKSETMHG